MNQPTVLDTEYVSYVIGDGALEKAKSRIKDYNRIFIITDDNVEKFCLPIIKKNYRELNIEGVITILSGEENKSIHQLIYIWNELTRLNVGRDDLILNVGGGVLTDIAGFASATFKRGVQFMNFPTTLLGMVDAAIGGKTGIDFDRFKNQVGLFVNPSCVVVDPVFLDTLAEEHWQSGFAEVMKYGLIMDRELWQKLYGNDFRNINDWNKIIIKAARDKIDIVRFDLMEKGIRKNLNFGHTIGHALESFYLKSAKPITHGKAIAAGMICESWISSRIFGMECSNVENIMTMIDLNFDRLNFTNDNIPRIKELMKQDKKVRNNKHNFSLLRKIGKAVHEIEVDDDLVDQSLDFYIHRKKCVNIENKDQ